MEDNLLYIKQYLEACQLDYRSLCYEDFIDSPDIFEKGSKSWWNISDESFANGKSEIREPISKSDIPRDISEQFQNFFFALKNTSMG